MLDAVPDIVVHLDEWASAEEVAAVEEAVRSSGLTADVQAVWRKDDQTGNGAFWMVAVQLGVPVTAYMTRLAVLLADDTHEALRLFVRKLREARRSSGTAAGWVEIEDSDGTRLMFGEPAEEAFAKLREMDLDARRGERLRWDERTREWVPY